MSDYWRQCSICKKEIAFNAIYQECSVSTCKKNAYCSVDCWDVHVPILNHKTSFAEESRAPHKEGKKRIIVQTSKSVNAKPANDILPADILIVASKLKNYVKAKHDLNTSSNVMNKLSDIVRNVVDDAINNARADGRKTLMDRDF